MDKLKMSPADGARREVRESQRWVGLILLKYHEYHVCKKFNGSPSNSGWTDQLADKQVLPSKRECYWLYPQKLEMKNEDATSSWQVENKKKLNPFG